MKKIIVSLLSVVLKQKEGKGSAVAEKGDSPNKLRREESKNKMSGEERN
jgi:hypothetical protein